MPAVALRSPRSDNRVSTVLDVAARLVAERLCRVLQLRDDYEKQFAALVGALPLAEGADRKALRLMLIGALNWSRFWFSSPGRDTPRSFARKFVGFIKEAQGG